MNDYKELIEETRGFANRLRYYVDEDVPYMEWEIEAVEDAADAIEQLVKERDASVDAEPVRHGHWLELWFDEEDRLFGELPSDYKCSICGGIVPRKTFQSGRYCPNCGAKMDEVSE